jgi:hypothetical protein
VRFLNVDRFFGDDSHRQRILREMADEPLASAMTMLPNVPPPRVHEYVDRATVGLYLGLGVRKQALAIPTKLFEYMAAGRPVVASDLPYPRQFVGQTGAGLLAAPGDADAFARAICQLIDHPDQARHMGLAGQRAVRRQLNWDCEMDKLDALYNEILRR